LLSFYKQFLEDLLPQGLEISCARNHGIAFSRCGLVGWVVGWVVSGRGTAAGKKKAREFGHGAAQGRKTNYR
jgi:hypothetical protein